MNIKAIGVTIGLGSLFFLSIWIIANEMSYLSLIHRSGWLLILFSLPAIIAAFYAHRYVSKSFEGEDVIRYTGISFVFFLLISEAFGLFVNRWTSVNCQTETMQLIEYAPMFVSGYGHIKSEVTANRWEMKLLNSSNNQEEVYVVKSPIWTNPPQGQSIEIEFCSSVFGFKMLSI